MARSIRKAFASVALARQDRDPFLDRMTEAGIRPNIPFHKDLSLVKVTGFRMTFENGMVLVGSREDLDERVRAPEGGSEGVVLKDAVKSLQGR